MPAPLEFPVLKWFGLAFLAVLVPCYWHEYGPMNFLQLCDIALFVTVAGWWLRSPLLLSSQLVSCLVIDTLWCSDLVCHALAGKGFCNLAGYMFSPGIPLFIRGLSFFHVFWPILLLLSVRRAGYDWRAWPFQAGLALLVMTMSLILGPLFAPGSNINNVFRFPVTDGTVGPQPVHMLVTWAIIVAVLYTPAHFLLNKLWGRRA